MFRLPVSHVRISPSPKQSFGAPALARNEKRATTFTVPRDGIIRAVASEAARSRCSSSRIVRFDKVVRVYCGMVLGFTDRYTVGEYVYIKLKGLVERAKKGWRIMTRKDLEKAGRAVFSDIEAQIIAMAESGRTLKTTSHRGYIRVMASFIERKGKCFLTLGRPSPTGERKVLCLETKGSFRRRKRTRFNRKDEYRNTPRRTYH